MSAAIAAIFTAVVGAVGAGISYRATTNAANAKAKFSELNLATSLAQSKQQGQLARLDAMTNEQLALANKKGHEITAIRMENQAESDSNLSNENARKAREQTGRYVSASRVALAESGLIDTTGSPWELIRQQIVDGENQAQETRYQDEVNRRSLFMQAKAGRRDASSAEMESIRYSAAAATAGSAARIEALGAKIGHANTLAGVRSDKMAAMGGLVTSVASTAGSYYQRRRNTPSSAGALA